jgi:hypothetical protein
MAYKDEAMTKLRREDLWSLEDYDQRRPEFRRQVMAHKKNRVLVLGEHLRLCFEDRLTMQYQIQEMLRIEKVFDAAGIEDELAAYNPLIPDGDNWKATLMLEYDDVAERQRKVIELVGIEQKVWLQVDGFAPVIPVADEDMERSDAERTSTVHFLRYQLTSEQVQAVRQGAEIYAGVDHPHYAVAGQTLPEKVQASLRADVAV